MKTCILSFSSRPNGNCQRIAEEIRQSASGQFSFFDFSNLKLHPCGSCDYSCFLERERCPYFSDPVASMYDAITNSDQVYMIVPNYCDYPCSNFFLFNERGQCYFQRNPALLGRYLDVKKRFIVVSNTNQSNFVTAFRYHIPEGTEPEILFLSARQYGKSSIQGDLMDSAQAREAVACFVKTELTAQPLM